MTATGPNAIPGILLKSLSDEVLTKFFQASLDQGNIPLDWKKAFISPIFKKGDRPFISPIFKKGDKPRQTQPSKLQACIFDINMLQDTGTHCAQPRDQTS